MNHIISKQCCNCQDTGINYKPIESNAQPISIASDHCIDRKEHECNKTRIIATGTGPVEDTNQEYILNKVIGPKPVENYYEDRGYNIARDNNGNIVKLPYECQTYATYCDPRVRNAVTGDLIKLDTIPQSSEMPMSKIYDESLRGYGQGYVTYRDINAGQIQYSVSKSDQSAYKTPNYVLGSTTIKSVREDPMGGMIPEYNRTPNVDNMVTDSKYQHTRDELRHRENLMDGIKYRHNKSDYGLFWEHIVRENEK